MHHLANSINKLCHGKKQDSTAWKDVRMYHCSREEAVFVIVGRGGGCLYARGLIRFDSLRFGIRYSDARIATMLYVTVFASLLWWASVDVSKHCSYTVVTSGPTGQLYVEHILSCIY